MMLVGQHMTQPVQTITPHTNFREVRDLMHNKGIRRLPVVDHGKLVGIVTETDVMSTAPSPATTLSVYEIYTLLDRLEARQFMKHPVLAVAPDCPLQDAAQIMITHKIGCLPVVRATDVVGIITETDVMRVIVEMLGGGTQGCHFTVRIKDEPGTLAALCAAVANAGGNIISLAARAGSNEVTVKEQGANLEQLKKNLSEAKADLIVLQDGKPYTALHFGA
ncbi:MAG TPA: CBS domain-containing protein [Aggregatilineales bacterium]|nr:CBS domain-containing protein [Anaerolineales bacterium]HRE49252.1 CBS domain-containing protein [Aggregatilineales bacterium]